MLRLIVSNGQAAEPPRALTRSGGHDPLWALVVRARAGEQGAQRTLLNAVGAAQLRVTRGVLGAQHPDVDDVLQEACVALLSALPRFRGQCTTLHFACRVAVLTAMNARRRSRPIPMADPDGVSSDDGTSSPGEATERARRREVLRQLLDELPPVRAEVLVLHVMLGHTVEETSAMLGVSVNTIRSRLRRALRALRDRVQHNRRLLEVIRGGHEG